MQRGRASILEPVELGAPSSQGERSGDRPSDPDAAPSVLVLDDDPDELRAALGPLRQPLVCVDSEQAALEAASRQAFAVVLIDLRRPSQDGPATAARLRAQSHLRDTPVLFVTGDGDVPAAVVAACETGLADVITRPYAPGLLRARVAVLVELYQRGRRLEASEARKTSDGAAHAELFDRYRLIGRAIKDVIWDWEIATNQIVWNEAVEVLFGYAPADVDPDARWWRERVHPDDRARVVDKLYAIIDGAGEVWSDEYRFRRRDGSYAYVLDRGHIARDAAGRAARMVGSMIDLTERRRVEESRRTLLRTIEESMDFIGVADLDGSFVYVNEAGQKLVGLRGIDEVRATQVLDYVMPEDRALVEATILPTVLGPLGRWAGEFRFRNFKTGEPIWMWWNIFTTRDRQSGQPVAIATTSLDLTPQKAAEAERLRLLDAARESEQRFRTLAETMPQLVWTTLPDGESDYFNQRLFAYMGTTLEQMQREGWSRLIHDDDRARVDEAWQRSLRTGEPFELHYRIRRGADGAYRWFLGRATPHHDREGRITRWFGTCTDIEDQKQAEVQVKDFAALLERQVNERTALLQEANRELEAFSYSVSHDLRAPVRHVVGYAEKLRKSLGPTISPDNDRFLTIVTEAGRRMGALIDALLSLSRMSRAEVRRLRVDMRQLVTELVREHQREAPEREITFVVGELPEAVGDPVMLRLVWNNLLGNAVKYSKPRASAHIEVGARSEDGETIYFVRDDGVGFDMRYADKLFGVFQRLHRPEDFEGTGIGLASVRRIVHRHGGRTWAEGAVDQGATFYFSLPTSVSEPA